MRSTFVKTFVDVVINSCYICPIPAINGTEQVMNPAQTNLTVVGSGFQRCSCATPFPSSEAMTANFVAQIKAGYIHPTHMADVLYAMHAALVDRFPAVGLWLPTDLEQVADSVLKAERIQERQEQDYPEAVAA